MKIRDIYSTWNKCQRPEPGNFIRAQECSRNAGLSSIYQAAGSAHSAAHKASLHSLPPLELTHLTSLCQRTTRRAHTGAPIDGGARTGARTPRLRQEETGRRSQLQREDSLGKLRLFFHTSAGARREGFCVLLHGVSTRARTESRTLTRALMISLLFSIFLLRLKRSPPQLSHVVTSAPPGDNTPQASHRLWTESQTFHWFCTRVPLGSDPLLLHLPVEELGGAAT